MPASGNRPGPPPDTGPSIEDSIRDAQARSLDFPATERATYIRAMVHRAQEFREQDMAADEIKEKLPEFARDYPHLFDSAITPDFDQGTLQTMLAMLERMGQGTLNHHQATVIVGKKLAQKYIKPDRPQ